MYIIGHYRDSETNRKRWAVFDSDSKIWYFPDSYGKRAAQALADRLNRGVERVSRLQQTQGT